MKKLITLLFFILLIISVKTIFAQKTWTGATSTAWNTPGNWSPTGVPTSADDVIIPQAPTNQPFISGTITPVCKNLTINAGASLNISATTTNNALLTASGNANINGYLTIGGALSKTGKLNAVNITWASGSSMSGFLGGSIDVSGNWEFSAGSAITMGFCSVNFIGTSNTNIISKSSTSSFSTVSINKTASSTLYISNTSTATLKFGGSITIGIGATLIGSANITTIFEGNLNNNGHFSFNSGNVSFEKSSGTQSIQVNTDDFFNIMTINSGGTVTINNQLTLLSNLIISSGVFDPLGNTIIIFGGWFNNVGPDSFNEGSGKVIFSGGNYNQLCSTEIFNVLEVNKTIGGNFRMTGTNVTCNQYDWTAGSIEVTTNGSFTALDLADDGIRGNYYVNTGCTINLHQDNFQYVDLSGNLSFNGGGTINIYGGSGYSQWPGAANASVTMNGGTLDFVNNGISINNSGTYTLTSGISGGLIRTSKGFYCERADFNPTGGTIEMYGSSNENLSFTAGSLWNLEIDKDVASSVTLITNLSINGSLTVNGGTITYANKVVTLANALSINSGGTFNLGMAGQLKMSNGKTINVENAGTLITDGATADNAVITHNTAGYYFIYVKNGGTFSANNTYFSYLNYIYFNSGATLDPANAFYRCTFANNSANPSGGILYFANNQDVSINNAYFTSLTSAYNVSKLNDAGHIYFKDATGAYSGATYENDPYNRIDWLASTPGLWTGVTSSDWYTASNWDDYNVPTPSTNVTIPPGTPNSPVIGSGNAYCYDILIEQGALLSQNAGNFYVYAYFNSETGQFIMTGNSYLYFTGTTNTLWIERSQSSSCIDTYTNVRIAKSNISVYVTTSDFNHINNIQNLRVIEGTLAIGWVVQLKVKDTGTEAFWVENGGRVIIPSPFTNLDVDGNIHFANGSIIEITEGEITCGKDLIVETGSFVSSFSGLAMKGSGTQYIDFQSGDAPDIGYLIINKSSGICYNKSGNLSIEKVLILNGTLSCNNGPTPTATYDIYVERDWYNSVGPSGFQASSGKVIFISGGSSNVEGETNFNILEIDKGIDPFIIEDNVTCAAYSWTSGSVQVGDPDLSNNSSFTANDLLDNAIKGSFICTEGSTINLTNSGTGTFVDLAGELHNFGGTINISGSLCYWPFNGNAVVEMTSGIIDIKTCGLYIDNNAWSLTDNITGGTIRTAYGFTGNRSDFTPTAGTFEFYGSNDASISQYNGCSLPNVTINKSAKESEKSADGVPIFDERTGEMISDGGKTNMISLNTSFSITKNLIIQSGVLNSNNFTINIEGDWYNLIGPDGFIEGAGRVIFNGDDIFQHCSTEEFNILEIDRPDASWSLVNLPGASISCQVYDWTQGEISMYGENSHFYAADLLDDGIHGFFEVGDNCSIELHQDALQSVDLIGNVHINGGEFTVYGGNNQSSWGINGNGSLSMSGGIMHFVDQPIVVQDVYPYNFSSNISGGTIRTRSFIAQSPGFDPSGGTVEIIGDNNGQVLASNGAYFHDLKINTDPMPFYTNIYSSIINNNLIIEEGSVSVGFENTLECGNVIINSGGDLRFNSSTLKMKNNGTINVNSGGYLSMEGYEGAKSTVTGINPTDLYQFTVNSGGMIYPRYTIFENMNTQGLNIASGASVLEWQPFKDCEFRKGASGGTLLNINNDQDLFIENSIFPANTWVGQYNVQKNLDAGQVFFSNASAGFSGAAFENDPFNRIFWTGQPDSQTITIPAGWSGLSSYLQPAPENDIQNIMEPVFSDFTILMNNTGIYYPYSGINTLVDWMSQDAFKVKMESETTLTINGGWELNKSFDMNTGWNLMPVIFNDSWDAPFAANQLGSNLVIIKEVAGPNVFWPQFGINTLYWLSTGRAYYVLLSAPGSVTFPENDVKAETDGIHDKNLTGFENLSGLEISPTPSSHTIAILPSALVGFLKGDIIGAFDHESNCFGTAVYEGKTIGLTVFGDDPTTAKKDGFIESEMIFFKNLSGFENLTGLKATFDQNLPQSDGLFAENGLSAILGFESAIGIGNENSYHGVQVYPNPSEGKINIIGLEVDAEIIISDTKGQIVMDGIIPESNTMTIDLSNLKPGMYFIKIPKNGEIIFRKILLK